MKRSPLTRKTPLKPSGPIKPKWPPQGSREKATKRRSRGKMPDVLTDVIHRRSRGLCEFHGPHAGCRGEQLHHRKLRSHGGGDSLENLVDICREAHHDVIHANPDWARRHGWIVPSWADPADIDVVAGCGLDCSIDHCGELS